MTTRKWGNEILVNTTTTGAQTQPAITALFDGGFMIAWTDENPAVDAITMQRFDALGNAVGPEFIPFDDLSGLAGSFPDLVQLSDGNIWFQTNRTDVFGTVADGQVVSLTGGNVRDQFLQDNYGDSFGAIVSLGANGSAGVYLDSASNAGDIFLDTFDTSGTHVVDSFAVNTNGGGSLAALQDSPDIAVNPDASLFTVVWRDAGLGDGDIRGRVFLGNGSPSTAEFTVNGLTSDGQSDPQVAWLDHTKFVVTWVTQTTTSTHGDGDGLAIKQKIFRKDGLDLTGERLVNTSTLGDQNSPALTALPNGGFAIAWFDTPDPSGDYTGEPRPAIKLQVFDGLGDKAGGEIIVSSAEPEAGQGPSLTALKDGRIAVTWVDAGSDDIHSQIVDPRDGVVDGTIDSDTLYGHDAVGDILSGFSGDDTLNGLGGADVGYGGIGDDRFNGNRGDDTAYGGLGNDDLRGDGGEDEVSGEDGNDVLRGGKGDDEVNGGGGNDILVGNAGADALAGGLGNDTASYSDANAGVATALDGSVAQAGDAAGDTYSSVENLVGSGSADTLAGSSGANTLEGRNGADTLDGKAGADRMIGGVGGDTQTGGAGGDTFVFNASSEGSDTIADFSQAAGNNDGFELKASGFGGGLVAGPLLANQFQDNNTSAAANGNVRVIYNQATGQLYFDADGNGGGAAVLLATLSNSANLALGDFTVV